MRIFVLEDDPVRLLWFMDRFREDDLICCTTVDEAVNQFRGQSWDAVLLDHDLGGEVFVDSARDDTGAGFIRRCGVELALCPTIAIHSMNQAGAERMLGLLADFGMTAAKWIPFPMLKAGLS